jgi:EPS-associated MarR family transcriptional regulator
MSAARKNQLQQDTFFWMLRRIQNKPDVSQRDLAKELGMSLGSVNYCLQALVKKGLVKMQNFSQSNNKLSYMYILTQEGIAEKALLTSSFLKRKLDEYEVLRAEIERIESEVDRPSQILEA